MIEDNIKENKEINMNNCDENNLFDIIILLFTELFEKYSLCCYDNIYSETQKRRFDELLLVVGRSCFNFYYGENYQLNFSIINNSIKNLNKNYYFEKEKKLCYEYENSVGESYYFQHYFENSINHDKNYRDLKEFYCDENGFDNCSSSNTSPIFDYYVLEKIIENSDIINMMNMSFSNDIEIVDNMEFLLNNPYIQSIFYSSIKSSFISIKSSNTFIYKRKKSNYKYSDKKFLLFYFILFYL
jgi:hypothetical protein